jgi:hypothetical protein
MMTKQIPYLAKQDMQSNKVMASRIYEIRLRITFDQ